MAADVTLFVVHATLVALQLRVAADVVVLAVPDDVAALLAAAGEAPTLLALQLRMAADVAVVVDSALMALQVAHDALSFFPLINVRLA
jgi:hypothetical protein